MTRRIAGASDVVRESPRMCKNLPLAFAVWWRQLYGAVSPRKYRKVEERWLEESCRSCSC